MYYLWAHRDIPQNSCPLSIPTHICTCTQSDFPSHMDPHRHQYQLWCSLNNIGRTPMYSSQENLDTSHTRTMCQPWPSDSDVYNQQHNLRFCNIPFAPLHNLEPAAASIAQTRRPICLCVWLVVSHSPNRSFHYAKKKTRGTDTHSFHNK